MSIEATLYSLLSADAAVAALVSDRIYPIYLPQTPTYPAVAYRRNSTSPVSLLSADTNLLAARFEVAAFSKSFDQCIDLADKLRAALQRYQGTVGGVVVEDIMLDNIDQSYEPDFEVYESTLDITIHYRT